jgi:hypothetical protein
VLAIELNAAQARRAQAAPRYGRHTDKFTVSKAGRVRRVLDNADGLVPRIRTSLRPQLTSTNRAYNDSDQHLACAWLRIRDVYQRRIPVNAVVRKSAHLRSAVDHVAEIDRLCELTGMHVQWADASAALRADVRKSAAVL